VTHKDCGHYKEKVKVILDDLHRLCWRCFEKAARNQNLDYFGQNPVELDKIISDINEGNITLKCPFCKKFINPSKVKI